MTHETPATCIDTDSGLRPLVKRVRRAERVAIDTEADSFHHYFEKVCLIQLSVGGEHYLVDPLSAVDLSPLLAALATRELVLHGADYDLRMLRASFGFEPRGAVFDTMIAAQLLGCEQIGLAGQVERLFGVELPKRGQKADWSRRPLSQSLLDYALNDARFLLELADRLGSELERLGRLEWHAESCRQMVAATGRGPRQPDAEAWRIRGASRLGPRAMAILKEAWGWRDREARRADLPPFKVLGEKNLMELAEWAEPNPPADLVDKGPKLPRNCRGRRLSALRKALEKGRRVPQDQCPGPRKPPTTRVRGPRIDEDLLRALRAERDRLAGELAMSPSVLAPKASLLAIARHCPRSLDAMQQIDSLMRWQAEVLAPPFLEVLKATGRGAARVRRRGRRS